MKKKLDIRNPRSGEIDHHIIPANRAAIVNATSGLRQAQQRWVSAEIKDRFAALSAFSDCLRKHRVPLLEALTQDTGRRAISMIEIDGIASAIQRWGGISQQNCQGGRGCP